MNKKIRPLADQVLLQVLEAESAGADELEVADGAKEKQCRGKVLSVGPGRMNEDGAILQMFVGVGDEVLFKKHAGNEIPWDSKLVMVTEEQIIAVIEGA